MPIVQFGRWAFALYNLHVCTPKTRGIAWACTSQCVRVCTCVYARPLARIRTRPRLCVPMRGQLWTATKCVTFLKNWAGVGIHIGRCAHTESPNVQSCPRVDTCGHISPTPNAMCGCPRNERPMREFSLRYRCPYLACGCPQCLGCQPTAIRGSPSVCVESTSICWVLISACGRCVSVHGVRMDAQFCPRLPTLRRGSPRADVDAHSTGVGAQPHV